MKYLDFLKNVDASTERVKLLAFVLLVLVCAQAASANPRPGRTESFDAGWRFHLGDVTGAQEPTFDDSSWRALDLPHDWSIEGEFSEKNPATPGGGALPGGVGWYRKTFTLPASADAGLAFVAFDGVYRNSEVWLNGHSLGRRPYGYSSFEYEMTPYLNRGGRENVIAVRVDNSQQPNSRWYSGSGIYRNVWLTTTSKVFVEHWGTYVTTPSVSTASATVELKTTVRNETGDAQMVVLRTAILDASGREVARAVLKEPLPAGAREFAQSFTVARPSLWSLERPTLYTAVTRVEAGGREVDRYETPFGIRTFRFDITRGFFLNGVPVKIKGLCNHHDLGALGAAINTRALERQLEILKAMGANAIRTSHNPPAPELLELCDRLGFLVLDEAFDMWKKPKTRFDYHLDWNEWHRRDLEDMVRRDRNHPSVIAWSIGNEIPEQNDPTGTPMARELAGIVKALDPTRPVTSAMNEPSPKNYILNSGALDLLGINYHHEEFPRILQEYPGKPFMGTETTSALETRGHYDMPSDVIRRWPERWDKPFTTGNPDYTVSAYDNVSTPWGSTHEETWRIVRRYDFLSSLFIWTGFDYLGEPTPYWWPARSSYFGIVDLAGFPKDVYYMYQSEWTTKPVLHVFPHWNWKTGQTVDVWAYTNAEEVELFLNGRSLGTKRKAGEDLHLMWRVTYEPGTLRAVARTKGREVLTEEVRTAGRPARLVLAPDRAAIKSGGDDLSFVTVRVVDSNGVTVPDADNLVRFSVTGGSIAGVDNGSETSHEPFKADHRRAFNGMCLAIVRAGARAGQIVLTAKADGLEPATATIRAK